MSRRNLPKPKTATWLHYRQYFLTRTGEVVRATAGKGTHPGRVLKPYGPQRRVRLCHGDYVKQISIDQLIHVFNRR